MRALYIRFLFSIAALRTTTKLCIPNRLFYLLRIWWFRIWMTSTGQLVFLIHLLSVGVTKVEYPLTSWLTYFAHMFSISALLGRVYHVLSHSPGPLHRALTSHNIVLSGWPYFPEDGFYEWVFQMTESRSHQLKAWAPRWSECHLHHVLSFKAVTEPLLGSSGRDTCSERSANIFVIIFNPP